MSIEKKAVAYVEQSSQALAAASAFATKVAAEKQAAEKLIPDVVQLLRKQHLIDDGMDKLAHENLSGHEGTLRILTNVINHFATAQAEQRQKQAAELGSPEPATTRNKQANYVGRVRGDGDYSAADQALARGLGLEL